MGKRTLAEAEKELEVARDALAKMGTNQASLSEQLRATMPSAHPVSATAMVGIRNISDHTLGIKGRYGNADVQLHADFGKNDPASSAVIPYAWWRNDILRSPFVSLGLIVRDDSAVGEGYFTAPQDSFEKDYPASYSANVVFDPIEWIEHRSEEEIRQDIDKMSSDPSLRRIRRAVDIKLKELELQLADLDNPQQEAVIRLSTKYTLVDNLTTRKLERPDEIMEFPATIAVTKDGVREK